jgi:hypothetical protein
MTRLSLAAEDLPCVEPDAPSLDETITPADLDRIGAAISRCRSVRFTTATDVKRKWLAAVADDDSDALALCAHELVKERNAARELAAASIAFAVEQSRVSDQLRQSKRSLLEEIRCLRDQNTELKNALARRQEESRG